MGYVCKIKAEIIRLKQRNKAYSSRISTLNQWIEVGLMQVMTTQYCGLKYLEEYICERQSLERRQKVNGDEITRLRGLLIEQKL